MPVSLETTVYIDADLKELIPRYLQSRSKDVTNIREHVTNNDYESIRILGHTLKGSGYGFKTINDIGRELENAAETQSNDKIDELANALETFLSTVNIIFKAE